MIAESAEVRFARFKSRPDIVDVAIRYGDWAVSGDGIKINMVLSLLAGLRLSGQMHRRAYNRAVRDLAATTTIPLPDFLTLARCQLELLRSGLAGSGQIPLTPQDWQAADKRGS